MRHFLFPILVCFYSLFWPYFIFQRNSLSLFLSFHTCHISLSLSPSLSHSLSLTHSLSLQETPTIDHRKSRGWRCWALTKKRQSGWTQHGTKQPTVDGCFKIKTKERREKISRIEIYSLEKNNFGERDSVAINIIVCLNTFVW